MANRKPTQPSFSRPSSRRAALPLGALLALASVVSCRCIEHPLYDANVNRFDTWYLGGGNTQYRPFRSVQYDPDASFEVELRHRSEGEVVVIVARLRGEATADLQGELVATLPLTEAQPGALVADEPVARTERLAAFEHEDDDLVVATIDREALVELDRRGAGLTIRFVDEVGAAAHMALWPADLMDPRPTSEEAAR